MKKYIRLVALLTTLSLTTYAQNDAQIENSTRNPCFVQELDFGTYFSEHGVLTENSFDTILTKLNAVLNCKDIQVCREKRLALDAWFTLMRIQDIKWTIHKADILIYLKDWVEQILKGNSYLNQSNKNIFYAVSGCPYVNGDPITLPSSCYAITLRLDTKYGVKMIDDTWRLIIKDEPFENRLRNGVLNLMNIYYKNADVQLLLEKLEKTNIASEDIQKIQEIKFQYRLSQSKNQVEAWEKIILYNQDKSSRVLPIEHKEIWQKSVKILEKIFGYDLEVKDPLMLAEREKDFKVKYWLTYICCYLENGNYPKKTNEEVVKRIYKLVGDVQNQNVNNKTKEDIDYLDEVYQYFKKWH